MNTVNLNEQLDSFFRRSNIALTLHKKTKDGRVYNNWRPLLFGERLEGTVIRCEPETVETSGVCTTVYHYTVEVRGKKIIHFRSICPNATGRIVAVSDPSKSIKIQGAIEVSSCPRWSQIARAILSLELSKDRKESFNARAVLFLAASYGTSIGGTWATRPWTGYLGGFTKKDRYLTKKDWTKALEILQMSGYVEIENAGKSHFAVIPNWEKLVLEAEKYPAAIYRKGENWMKKLQEVMKRYTIPVSHRLALCYWYLSSDEENRLTMNQSETSRELKIRRQTLNEIAAKYCKQIGQSYRYTIVDPAPFTAEKAVQTELHRPESVVSEVEIVPVKLPAVEKAKATALSAEEALEAWTSYLVWAVEEDKPILGLDYFINSGCDPEVALANWYLLALDVREKELNAEHRIVQLYIEHVKDSVTKASRPMQAEHFINDYLPIIPEVIQAPKSAKFDDDTEWDRIGAVIRAEITEQEFNALRV